jgi:FMN-dependent NADH-azoreductase
MTTLLHLDASVRHDRSVSRRLTRVFVDAWRDREPEVRVLRRDLADHPPPYVDEAWISACFTKAAQRTSAMRDVLKASDELIAELECADVLVIGTPMFNYGMPARLKAWIDQVVRVDRTFSFDLARGDWPLEPILSRKSLVILTSSGEFGFEAGGVRADKNHLDTHLRVVSRYLGADAQFHIAVEYQEFGDARHTRSLGDALSRVPSLVEQVAAVQASSFGLRA